MLPRPSRLRSSADISTVYKKGAKSYQSLFRVMALKTDASTQATVVVSKQVSPRAVERNKIKRRLRAILQKQIPQFKQPVKLVVVAQTKAKHATTAELKTALETALHKLTLI